MKKVKIDFKDFVSDGNPKPTSNMEGTWKFRVDNNTLITIHGTYKKAVSQLNTSYKMIVLDPASVFQPITINFEEQNVKKTNCTAKDVNSFF